MVILVAVSENYKLLRTGHYFWASTTYNMCVIKKGMLAGYSPYTCYQHYLIADVHMLLVSFYIYFLLLCLSGNPPKITHVTHGQFYDDFTSTNYYLCPYTTIVQPNFDLAWFLKIKCSKKCVHTVLDVSDTCCVVPNGCSATYGTNAPDIFSLALAFTMSPQITLCFIALFWQQ